MLFFLIFILNVFAQTPTEFDCGEGLKCGYIYDSNTFVLTLSGNGIIPKASYNKLWYSNRRNIKKIIFGDEIIGIEKDAFSSYYSNLESIHIGKNIVSIGDKAFSNLNKLTLIEFTTGFTLKTIGSSAFQNSPLVSAFNFATIETIGEKAFCGTALKYADFTSALKSISKTAFMDCKNFESFKVENNAIYSSDSFGVLYETKDNVKLIHIYPENCKETTFTVTGVETLKENTFSQASKLQTLNLESVKTVDTNAIIKCPALTKVIIVANTNNMKKNSINDCNVLNEFEVTNGNTFFEALNGILYTKNVENKALVRYPPAKQISENYSIEKGIKVIYDYAFSYIKTLKEITIGNNVYSIHSFAFEGCTSLEKVTITAPVDSIGSSVFKGINSLKTVVIGDSVKMIGNYMFENCRNLNSLTLGKCILFNGQKRFA